ncbi:MAG: hypothetical protein M1268_04695 [Patescibacteria group bacterium]|nr:hypothetical protein [Patescibacteria group bacterium]
MSIQSSKIFIDSTVLYSFIDRADPNHQKTIRAFDTLGRLEYQVSTSSHNITEAYYTLAREASNSLALEFLDIILISEIEIIFPQKTDFVSALRILKANKEKDINFREALNVVLMKKRDIYQILTFNYWHQLFGIQASNLIR